MQDVLGLLRQYIEQEGYTVYSLSKRIEQKRTTVQKALSGARKLTPGVFEAITNVLCLTPEERKQLVDAYFIYQIGKKRYTDRMSILELIHTDMKKEFPRLAGMALNDAPVVSEKSTKEEQVDKTYVLSDSYQMMKKIESSILEEQCEKIQIYSVFSKEFFYGLRRMLECHPEKKVTIDTVLLLERKEEGKRDYCYNVRVLKEILPYLYKNSSVDSVRYLYGSLDAKGQMDSIFPYFLIIGNKVIQISEDFSKGLYLAAEDIAGYFRKIYDDLYQKSQLFTKYETNLYSVVGNQLNHYNITRETFSIDRQPCILILFDDEMIVSNLADRSEQMLKIALPFLKQQQEQVSQGKIEVIFSQEGLDQFARDGIVTGYYPTYLGSVPVEQRIRMLEKIIDRNRNTDCKCYMIDSKTDSKAISLNIEVQNPDLVLFTIVYDQEVSYFEFHENAVFDTFYDFVAHIRDHGLCYGLEQTNQYVEKLIEELKKQL